MNSQKMASALAVIVLVATGCAPSTGTPQEPPASATATVALPTQAPTDTPPPPQPTITATDIPTATLETRAAPDLPFRMERSDQEFGFGQTFQAALGDLDGDGDLDAVFANPQRNFSAVWLNDGSGGFVDTGQQLTQYGHGVGLADFDMDGDLDAFIACHQFVRPSKIYFNDGSGFLQDSGQDLGDGSNSGTEVNLADLNGDGYMDVHVQYFSADGLPDKVYLNDGRGIFADSQLALDEDEIVWGDLDGDGDADYFGKRWGRGYVVQVNDGEGRFSEGWSMDDPQSTVGSAALADFDGDGDLDALVANGYRGTGSLPSLLLVNDGAGGFNDSGQHLNETIGSHLVVGDLDGDDDLDVFVSNMDRPNEVWLNQDGQLSDSGMRLGDDQDMSVKASLGDLDGDGDLDAVVGRFNGGAEVWFNSLVPAVRADAADLQLLRTFDIPGYVRGPTSQCSLDFSPDGRLLVGACGANAVPVWEVRSGELLHALYDPPQQMVTCAFSPDGGLIACGGFDRSITLWDAGSGEATGTLGSHEAPIWEVAFSPDGGALVSCSLGLAGRGSGPGDVRSWNVESGQPAWTYPGRVEALSVAYHLSGRQAAFGSIGGRVGILEAATGELVLELEDPTRNTGDVAYSPSGRWLAAGSDDDAIYLWEVPGYELSARLEGHGDFVNGVAFSPDGSLLASGSRDGTVGVWNVAGGKLLRLLKGHQDAVLRVAFSPDGSLIASISWDGTVRLWGVDGETNIQE